jgi:hypothetical protein
MSRTGRALTGIGWAMLRFARGIVPLPRAIRDGSWGNTALRWALTGTRRGMTADGRAEIRNL